MIGGESKKDKLKDNRDRMMDGERQKDRYQRQRFGKVDGYIDRQGQDMYGDYRDELIIEGDEEKKTGTLMSKRYTGLQAEYKNKTKKVRKKKVRKIN